MKQFFTGEFFREHREQVIKYGILGLFLLTALFVFFFRTGDRQEELLLQDISGAQAASSEMEETKTGEEESSEEASPDIVVVDVAGAVVYPGVVELDPGSRVEDAIVKAGGLSKEADVTTINRAAYVNDGEKIYIPKKGEEAATDADTGKNAASGAAKQGTEGANSSSSNGQEQQKINLNTAGSEELQTLNGIGPATAEKIILYRNQNGAFSDIEQIKNVDGIGEKTYLNIKGNITV